MFSNILHEHSLYYPCISWHNIFSSYIISTHLSSISFVFNNYIFLFFAFFIFLKNMLDFLFNFVYDNIHTFEKILEGTKYEKIINYITYSFNYIYGICT